MTGPDKSQTGTAGGPDIWGKRPAAFNPKNVRGQPPALSGQTSPDMSGCVRLCPGPKDEAAPIDHAAERARRLAIMGDHAGTAEGVRLLMQHDEGHRHAHSLLAAVTR